MNKQPTEMAKVNCPLYQGSRSSNRAFQAPLVVTDAEEGANEAIWSGICSVGSRSNENRTRHTQ